MYSVEDLLISHGYKLPRSGTAAAAAPYDNRNDCRRDAVENRAAGGSLNGFGTEGGAEGRTDAGVGGHRPAPAKAYPETNNNNENHDRIQRRVEAPIGYLGDLQPLGDSLATDSGFYDAPSLTFSEYTEERDISYWRRRGQDFSALLDYADPRELRVSGGLWRGPGLVAEDYRVERPLPRWEEGQWLREPVDSGPETLRVTGERKCQSLGTEEWRPAVGLGRQLSDGEAERWSQEQHLRLRPTEGSVPPAVRGKSQSLPRVLSPEDPQYEDTPQTGPPAQVVVQRVNGSAPYIRSHSDWTGGERWSGQGHGPAPLLPKPRFSRPVKPPSYEIHQQNRGSWETLSSEPVSKPRDRSLCLSQSFEPLRDRAACSSQSAEPLRERSVCFSQSAEPLRDHLVSHSQSADPFRDRLICHSQSADLLRDRLSHSQSADPLRDRLISHSQSADLLRDRMVGHSQSADLLRECMVSHSQSADLLRDRSLCYSQSSELIRDRAVCYSQSVELLRPEAQRPDLFYHDFTGSGLEPPGYIPPPSYRRFPPPRGGPGYRADAAYVRWKREPVSAEMERWFSRQAGLSWSERREDRNMIVPRRPVHPGPAVPNQPGLVQYVSFDDPRIRHISGGPSGNSLTDTDKIRHVNKELPCTTVLGQSTHDSAFLSTQGLSLNTDTHKTVLSEHENANRWHRAMIRGNENVAPEQSGAKHHATFQVRPSRLEQISTDRATDQQVRADRVTDQVKAERVTDQVKAERTTDQAKTDRTTEQVKTDRTIDQVKAERNAEQGKTDRNTDQVKTDRLTEQIKGDRIIDHVKTDRNVEQGKIDRITDQAKGDTRFSEKLIKPEKATEQIKSDRIPDKHSKAEKLLDKPLKVERVAEKFFKTDKITDKLTKADKMSEKMKADKITEFVKTDKIPDKHSKDDKPADKGTTESVSLSKTEPIVETEKPKSVKKKLSETIFCLVSVPVSLQAGGKSRDQNNNEEKEPDSPPIPPPPPPSSSSENSNTLGSLPNQSLKSTSTTSTDLELQALTGSVSISKHPRRAHRRKDSHSRIIKPNPHDELRRYSGAWPGDQYRDQETQTSPEPTKSTPHSGPSKTEAQDTPAAPDPEAPVERGGGVEPGTPYGYPIKGQKSLKPSSNSAFSRTGTSAKSTGSHRPPLHPPPHPPPPPPNQPPSQPPPPPPNQQPKSPPSERKEEAKAAPGLVSEAFGQFLLKPVSRRPWDAIEELESINKEMQDQAGKRPSVDQCIEDLNEAYKDILELSTASNNLPNLPSRSSMQIPDRIKARLPAEPLGITGSALRSSLVSVNDPEYREVKSAFSRPSTGKSVSFSKQLREEICPAPPPPETGFRDYRTVMSQISQRSTGHCRTVKLDIPPPTEIPLKDEDLTAQTSTSSMAAEVPWADRQPMQDASTLTSPPDYEHICQSLQLVRDTGAAARGDNAKAKPGSGTSDAPQSVPKMEGPSVDSEQPCCTKSENEKATRQELMPLFREERSSSFRKVPSQSNRFLSNRGPLCSLPAGKPPGEGDTKAPLETHPDVPADWRMQLSLAEKHLETLITGDGVSRDSAEDLDDVSNEKGACGDTGSASMEEQAAMAGGTDGTLEPTYIQGQDQAEEQTEQTQSLEPSEEQATAEGDDTEQQDIKAEETELHGQREPEATEHRTEPSLRAKKVAMWTHSGMDPGLLPEFPPDRLPLSVLAHPNRRLSLGVDWEGRGCEVERWSHGGGWARERRSLDAERRGTGGDGWGLDDYQPNQSSEKRGLGGWRGFDIDRQGTDDDWDIDIDITDQVRGLGIKGGSCVKKHKSSSGQQSSSEAENDTAEKVKDNEGQDERAVTEKCSRKPSQHSKDQQDGASAQQSPVAGERHTHTQKVDPVSGMRCLHSTHSQDVEEMEISSGGVEEPRDNESSPPDSMEPQHSTEAERESATPPTLTNEPGETQESPPTLTGAQPGGEVVAEPQRSGVDPTMGQPPTL